MRFDIDDPDIKPLRIFPQKMQAALYNTIRLGILRIANPLEITLDKQPNIKCYLRNNKWIFVDTILHEFPLVVWRDFETRGRGIHEPVLCNVYVYHMMAGRLMGTGLYAVEEYIQAKLQQMNDNIVQL